MTHVYAADIDKSYRNDAGDLVVEGIATSPDLDLDQQVCDPTWLKTAMPAWMAWGNVREMHGPNAAGNGTELEHQDGDRWHLKSVITDTQAAHKVETKTYKGYSIGIKDPRVVKDAKAPGGRIIGGTIVEVSLVDRPCNPIATLTLAKAAKPGMTLKVADLDQDRMLVKVEEIGEHPENADEPALAEAPPTTKAAVRYPGSLAQITELAKTLTPSTRDRDTAVAHIVAEAQRLKRAELLPADLLKAAQHDATEIASVRDGLVACINAELAELCDGEPELCDIEQLLCSLRMLMCWWEHEALGGETTSPYSADDDMDEVALWLAAQPEKEKAVGDTDTTKTEETKTVEPDTGKTASTTSDTVAVPEKLTELVKAAVTEANKAAGERIAALEAELVKVKAAPVPGGPVIARTSGDSQAAERAEKVAHFTQLAKSVHDPDLKAFYKGELSKLAQNGA